jgi:hypothetical protein
MLAGLLIAIPTLASAKDPINYQIVFEHLDGTTTTVSGVANDNDHFVPDAGGTSKTNPTGMIMHLSCSDDFPGGWGEKQGPTQGVDTEWRVKSFSITKGSKTCGGGDPIPPPSPAIDIEKATNGEDADDPTGPQIPVGDPVTWTYVVTNTGDVALREVKVVDYVPTVGSADATDIVCPRTQLGVGESMTCQQTGTAEEGQYANEAKVTAIGDAGSSTPINGLKKQFTFIFVHPDGSTTRIDGGSGSNEAFLPNAGGTSATNPTGMTVHVSCSDKFTGGWGEKDGPDQFADSAWKVQSFFIREVKDGQIKKSCGTPIPNTQMVMDQDPSHYIGIPGDPDIDIEKATNGEDADRPADAPVVFAGDRVVWTYVVTNTGDVPLFDIEVEDDIEGFIGSISGLRPGQSTTLRHVGIARAGLYANEGCVRAETEDGDEVDDCDPSHYRTPKDPDIDIEKATNGHDADRPQDGPLLSEGDRVTWTYVVTNTGDVDLVDIDVTDDIEGFIGTIDFLAVGDSTTLRHTGVAGDGDYANEGCARGMTRDNRRVSDCDPSHYRVSEYGPMPAIDIEKATNGEDADTPTGPRIDVGDKVTWTYVITNTGDETLYGVYVYDEEEGQVTCPMRTLRPGQSMTCTLEGRAMEGQYANEAWVTGWTDNGMVEDSDWSHYKGVDDYNEYPGANGADIDIEKATNGQDADTGTGPSVAVGAKVTWTYVITNTGDETLYGVYVYDEQEGHVTCPMRTLRAGQTMTCTLEGRARAGQYANEAWVNGWGEDGMVEDTDWSHYRGI